MVTPAGTVLVVGAGAIGRRHFQNLQTLGASAELLPWRGFDAVQVGARRDVAGLVIATQTPIRLQLIHLAAQNGWPFYAEKPLAWTRAQVAAIHDAAAPVAHRSMVGFMMRYHPALRALAALDLSGVFRIQAEIGHDVRQWRENWRFAGSYAAEPLGGGVLLDLCHEIDITAALFGPIALHGVHCLGHGDFPGVDFATSIGFCTQNGAAGTVAMDYLSPVYVRKMALTGVDFRIEADFHAPSIGISRPDGTGGLEQVRQSFDFQRNDMFLAAMGDFLALAGGMDLPPDPLRPMFNRMRPVHDLIAAAWESRAFTGQVRFDLS